MGELMTINVLINGDHRLGRNEFVKGKIVGIMEMICKSSDRRFAMRHYGFGEVLKTECTAEEYVEFKTIINQKYPELCKIGIEGLVTR